MNLPFDVKSNHTGVRLRIGPRPLPLVHHCQQDSLSRPPAPGLAWSDCCPPGWYAWQRKNNASRLQEGKIKWVGVAGFVTMEYNRM